MTPDRMVTPDEQLQVLRALADRLRAHGRRVLALGSAAVVLRTGQVDATTKDLDVFAYPVDDVVEFEEAIREAVEKLDGSARWEPDGASITLRVPVNGQDVPVEVILGREDFIQQEVLEDAVDGAGEAEDVLVPSWEHVVAMKAEAWFDRVGEEQRKYLLDLARIADSLDGHDERLDREEIQRIVELRPERKRTEMLRTIERVFAGLLE